MSSTYTKTEWQNDVTPLSDENMNNIEKGLDDIYNAPDSTDKYLKKTSDGVEWATVQGGGGSGSVNTVNDVLPDDDGNVMITGEDIKIGPVYGNKDIQSRIVEIDAAVDTINSKIPDNTSLSNYLVNLIKLHSETGLLTDLNTKDKTTLVNAINETNSKLHKLSDTVNNIPAIGFEFNFSNYEEFVIKMYVPSAGAASNVTISLWKDSTAEIGNRFMNAGLGGILAATGDRTFFMHFQKLSDDLWHVDGGNFGGATPGSWTAANQTNMHINADVNIIKFEPSTSTTQFPSGSTYIIEAR